MANREILLPSQLPSRKKFTPTELAWLTIFNSQLEAIAKSQAELHRKYDAKIAKIEAKIKKLRKQMDDKIAAVMSDYPPLDAYVPLTKHEMKHKCWAEHTRRLCDAGQPAPIITDAGMKKAVVDYHEIVHRRHMLDFLRRGNNQELLISTMKKIIAENPEGKRERRMREIVEIVGAQPIPPPVGGGEDLKLPRNKGKFAASVEEGGGTGHSRRKK